MKPPVPCPQCRQPTRLDTGNPWRPFCSERCKLLDLGEWFEESRAIPAEDQAPGLGENSDPDDSANGYPA